MAGAMLQLKTMRAIACGRRRRVPLYNRDGKLVAADGQECGLRWSGGRRRRGGRGRTVENWLGVFLVENGGCLGSDVVDKGAGMEIANLLRQQAAKNAGLNADGSPVYKRVGGECASHSAVNHHVEEYARGTADDTLATTDAVGGFFGNSNQWLDGAYQDIKKERNVLD